MQAVVAKLAPPHPPVTGRPVVDRVAGGETVRTPRQGKPGAQITAGSASRKRIDVEALRAIVARMPAQTEPAGAFMRQMLDAGRY